MTPHAVLAWMSVVSTAWAPRETCGCGCLAVAQFAVSNSARSCRRTGSNFSVEWLRVTITPTTATDSLIHFAAVCVCERRCCLVGSAVRWYSDTLALRKIWRLRSSLWHSTREQLDENEWMEWRNYTAVWCMLWFTVLFSSVTNSCVASHKHMCILCRQVYGCQGNHT